MAQFWTVYTISQCSHLQTAQKNAELRDKRQTQDLENFSLSKPWVLFSSFFLAQFWTVPNFSGFSSSVPNDTGRCKELKRYKSRRVVLPLLPYNERVRSRRAMRRWVDCLVPGGEDSSVLGSADHLTQLPRPRIWVKQRQAERLSACYRWHALSDSVAAFNDDANFNFEFCGSCPK